MKRLFGLRTNTKGSAALEFAFAVPVLMFVIVGCLDISQFLVSVDRVRRVALTSANDIAQWWSVPTPANNGPTGGQGPLGPIGMSTVMGGVVQMAQPLIAGTATGQFSTITTFVQGQTIGSSTVPIIQGQVQYPAGAGNVSFLTNTVGGAGNNGQPATLPAGFSIQSGDQAIFTEVFYTFNPFPLNVLGILPQNLIGLKDYAVYRPRQTINYNPAY